MDRFALVLPGEPDAVRLMNTLWSDRARVRDALGEPAHLQRWVAAVRPQVRVEATDLDAFRTLREALHVVARHHLGDHAAPSAVQDALAVVNAATASAQGWSEYVLTADGLACRPTGRGTPVGRLLADLASEALDLLLAGDLEKCRAHGCAHYYTLKPHRRWCSQRCGNRVRVARHYHRRRENT
ncbi:CGNR zinc finger domain-containing protein [Saccharothrix longispora]|uniref:CGNR zinc finger domain-containing protein n=1 Tax=Saccharothrix longispora TaxID=33920 RepID=UPI0028FD2A5E|nr:ABATE domain-containing protein [Saccharothrix longispora]MDU0290756.1 ABATE domain-containing protein [Saccharothrix longispora]